jgi:maltooligosyltrehalose trehalohydrolase
MAGKNIDRRTYGVNFRGDGNANICVWAPLVEKLELKLKDGALISLKKDKYGVWTLVTNKLGPGDKYLFVINGEKECSDPASLYQPDGVHGWSQAVDVAAFEWTDDRWQNCLLRDYIFYELHTGTFNGSENFEGINEKLDYLVELGITAIEIMPVAQFPGGRNWGYDGVFPFAVQNTYGGPAGLQALVNACHQKGLAVVLDVVYNHLGPEGNHLPAFGPYFTEKYKTPWGNALNFDDAWCDGVRGYFIENALMWFRDFHIDGLRMDAIHAIKDFSPKHILQEISENAEALIVATGKAHHLIIECDLNDTRFINPLVEDGYGIGAQWIDEFHHSLRVAAGQEKTGYYADFNGVADLAKSYRDAYVYDGQYSFERHKKFGERTSNPGDQFVVFSQNHDHVGNRMLGERTSQLVSFEMQKLLAAAVFVSPYLPLIFMGEEWSAPSPFQYFVSYSDKELMEAVRKGRREEFKAFHASGETPDPESPETFKRSKMNWALIKDKKHQTMLDFYKGLIRLKKKETALRSIDRKSLLANCDAEANTLTLMRSSEGQRLICLMNFSGQPGEMLIPKGISQWQKLFDTAEPEWLGPKASPSLLSSGTFKIQPESMVIYTEYYV